jgi:ankyrin repeat protein
MGLFKGVANALRLRNKSGAKQGLNLKSTLNSPRLDLSDLMTAYDLVSHTEFQECIKFVDDHPSVVYREDQFDNTLLFYALSCKDDASLDLVKIILEHGGKTKVRNAERSTPLHLAIKNNNVECVRLMLDQGAPLNARNVSGRTPLHLACECVNARIVAMLIGESAKINATDVKGQSALHLICQVRSSKRSAILDIVTLLLNHGANPNKKCNKGRTPLLYACSRGYKMVATLLLQRGGGTEETGRDDDGNSTLGHAIKRKFFDVARGIVEHFTDISHLADGGKECLEWALSSGDNILALLLLEKGADPTMVLDEDRNTPLHLACCHALVMKPVITYLLSSDVEIDAMNSDTVTPLMFVLSKDMGTNPPATLAIIASLLRCGAKRLRFDSASSSTLHIAVNQGNSDLVEILIRKFDDLPSGIIISGSEEAGGIRSSQQSRKGRNDGGGVDASLLLGQGGASAVPLPASPSELDPKVKREVEAASRIMFDAETEQLINCQDGSGQTPLHLALAEGLADIAVELLHMGGRVDVKDKNGETCIDLGRRNGHEEAVSLLEGYLKVTSENAEKVKKSNLKSVARSALASALLMTAAKQRGNSLAANEKVRIRCIYRKQFPLFIVSYSDQPFLSQHLLSGQCLGSTICSFTRCLGEGEELQSTRTALAVFHTPTNSE